MAAISSRKSKEIAKLIVSIEPRFTEVVAEFGPCPIGVSPSKVTNFAALVESILGQQLSIKAADKIIGRVKKLCNGKITPKVLGLIPTTRLREAGCSSHKARAVQELAIAVNSGELNLRSIGSKSEEEIFQMLIPMHGVGRWTVDMFLIFQLGRVDIWPVGDLGVRRGWEKVHRINGEINPTDLLKAGKKFRPYRSHLAWYCWRAHSIY